MKKMDKQEKQKVESIEKDINAKIKELEDIKINDFDFILN